MTDGIATTATAFAPASIGNLGVGFDVLGLAIAGPGDRVTAQRQDAPGVVIADITGDGIGADAHLLSADALRNTAGIAAAAVWQAGKGSGGVSLTLHKGTPLGSGMGSSAASAVAGAVAANALLEQPLAMPAVLEAALEGEALASGARHADNVAPSLFGGLVLCPPQRLPHCESLALPDGLVSVLVHPHLRVDTAAARQALADTVPLATAVTQAGLLACFVQACARGDRDGIAVSLRDVMIEHQRVRFVPGFEDVQAAALARGALGASLSGSGPSVFAICDIADGDSVAAAMVSAFESNGVACDHWVSPVNAPGAVLESVE
ncbi:MAG: homoserine kinase [Pseudomonadota bacterium]